MDLEKRLEALEKRMAELEAAHQGQSNSFIACMEKIDSFSKLIVPIMQGDYDKINLETKAKLLKPNP